MNKPSIKIVELYLKNYAPFYESLGIHEFHIDKRNAPYNLTLIIGANGSGKSYLITELSPELLEHITGRISNRFIDGAEGEKRIHYVINETAEYVCTILYDVHHKAACFFKQIDLTTGETKELNPNGNVTSYQELCHHYLYYNKIYKNIGYITDNVKNIVSMSFTERQQLFSTWLPDTTEFLSASKIMQKKINSTRKEIELIISDITKISISSYKENLVLLKQKSASIENELLFYRDVISKSNLFISQLHTITISGDSLKERIGSFLNDWSVYEQDFHKQKEIFTMYRPYLASQGKDRLRRDIAELEIHKASLQSSLNSYQDRISSLSEKIERLRINTAFPPAGKESFTDIVSVDNTIKQLQNSIQSIELTCKNVIQKHPEYNEIVYDAHLNTAIKQSITLLLSLYQTGNEMLRMCDGFTLQDIFGNSNTILQQFTKLKENIERQNNQIENTIKTLQKNEEENYKLQIDPSFLSFIPNLCSEETCRLVREIKNHICCNNISYTETLLLKENELEQNKKKLEDIHTKINTINAVIKSAATINNILFENKDMMVVLPETIFKRIQTPHIHEFIPSISSIIQDLQELDEYVSLLDKKKAHEESIKNLSNIYNIMKYNDKINEELGIYLEEQSSLYIQRKEISTSLESLHKKLDELSHIDTITVNLQNKREELKKREQELIQRQQLLLKENKTIHHKRILQKGLTVLKNKERDLLVNQAMVKTQIEECTTAMTSNALLEKRKETLEQYLNRYELLYSIWNPRTGYPSMLIKEFLDELILVTNASLDRIWGGIIRIESFKIDENEFRIPVIRGNTILNDISECSTAEKATLALALSLAITEISTSYNVIRIDETDGSFDESRRQSFLDILNDQLSTTGCEDCYVITHNQFFETVPCNVILLKDYDKLISPHSLDNKYILYRHSA